MANKKHIALLKQGVEIWNAWRSEYPQIRPDLSKVRLNAVVLEGELNREKFLRLAHKRGSHEMRGKRVNLRGANFRCTNFCKADFDTVDLRGADLSEANLRNAILDHADLRGAIFEGVSLWGTDLRTIDFRKLVLRKANLREANLSGGDLRGADLRGADLRNAILSIANLYQANLRGADLHRADLHRADLRGATLQDVSLQGVNLSGADLRGATLCGAHFSETTLGDTYLTNIVDLDSCLHHGPSTIDHRTLAKSWPLPLVFLRGCGLPDNLIEYLPSLLNEPLQFYSCFISYSSKDQEFAKRLHADLQNKGVRCWFAPEDLKIGDKFRIRIDESIRIHDKLLLILSEHSIASDWVEKEVETAMEKEREEQRIFLFPVRVDDAVMESKTGWAADVRRARNIGDFRRWKKHDTYQRAFERLLRDLEAAESKVTGRNT